MKLSKEKFLKYARKDIKDRMRPHLDILDGMEVNKDFEIHYKVDGKVWLLYPVMDEWCDK